MGERDLGSGAGRVWFPEKMRSLLRRGSRSESAGRALRLEEPLLRVLEGSDDEAGALKGGSSCS